MGHVCVQRPPVQPSLAFFASFAAVWAQRPPVQEKSQVAPASHDCAHRPPGHPTRHVESRWQVKAQRPSGHVSLQVSPLLQTWAFGASGFAWAGSARRATAKAANTEHRMASRMSRNRSST